MNILLCHFNTIVRTTIVYKQALKWRKGLCTYSVQTSDDVLADIVDRNNNAYFHHGYIFAIM